MKREALQSSLYVNHIAIGFGTHANSSIVKPSATVGCPRAGRTTKPNPRAAAAIVQWKTFVPMETFPNTHVFYVFGKRLELLPRNRTVTQATGSVRNLILAVARTSKRLPVISELCGSSLLETALVYQLLPVSEFFDRHPVTFAGLA